MTVARKKTLCGKPQYPIENIDNDNPTCEICHKRKEPLLSDLQWDDRLFQLWLNEYDEAYRHQLGQGIRPIRASYITYLGMPSYCKWLSHRLHDLRE